MTPKQKENRARITVIAIGMILVIYTFFMPKMPLSEFMRHADTDTLHVWYDSQDNGHLTFAKPYEFENHSQIPTPIER